jgi:excisionase family DNA binding protein
MTSRPKPAHPSLTGHDMLDAVEVAELLRMPASTVLDFARRGVIPGHKLGRRWIFLRDEIEATVREAPSRRDAPAPSQPGATRTAAPTRDRRRRYPRAVPDPTDQPKLFG